MVVEEKKDFRIDKFLWSVRVYKTRSQASEACRKGKVLIDEIPVKPSRILKVGDIIVVRKLPVVYTYQVIKLLEKRVSAKDVKTYCEDLTPQAELDKLKKDHITIVFKRERGAGRPTKRERRLMDKLREN
jgi:ribosome-associated heat shock protein Hsp15